MSVSTDSSQTDIEGKATVNHPGRENNCSISGNCQMEAGKTWHCFELTAAPKSSGCSQMILTRAQRGSSQTMLQMVKQKSIHKFPRRACSLNLPSSQGKPRGHDRFRKGHGPQGLLCTARLHVLFGGARKMASNSLCRTRLSNASATCGSEGSRDCNSKMSHSSMCS